MKWLIAVMCVVCAVFLLSNVEAAVERTTVYGTASCGQPVRQTHVVRTKRVKGCSGASKAVGCSGAVRARASCSSAAKVRMSAVRVRGSACPGGICP